MTNDSSSRRDEFELPPSKSRIGRAVDDELTFHIEERVRELVASGIDPATARAQATAAFGDVDAARRDLRRIDELAARRSWAEESVGDLFTDARRTLRALARRPGYALAATLTLALGVGANSTMFALVDRLLLSPPPHIRDADDVVRLRIDEAQPQGGRITWGGVPYSYYRVLTQARLSFDVAGGTMLSMTMRVAEDARAGTVVALTPGYFALLGTQPALGRFLVDGDASDERSVVISHALWSRELSRDESVIGRDITLGTESFRIVGVAPRGFTGDGIDPVDAWIALGATTPGLPNGWRDAPRNRSVALLGRPHRGVSPSAVGAEVTQHYLAFSAGTPNADSTARVQAAGLIPGRSPEGKLTPESRVALWLQAVSVLVLLIAVANVANLLLLRAIDRRRETAVAMALGVSRVRLVRHVVLESLLLGGAAAILAAALARWAGPVLWRLLLPMGAEAAATGWKGGAIVALLALVSALAMSVVPAVLQLKTPANDALRSGGRGNSRRGTLAGDVLVVLQVACAIVLLVGSGLFVRSFLRLINLDFGFELERVVAVRIDHAQSVVDSATVDRFIQDAEARVRAVPGVERTALSLTAPYQASLTLSVFLPGHERLPGVGPNGLGYPSFFAVSPDFFATMGLTIQRGRGFGVVDAATAPRVMIVDATMARTFWPNADALGQCVRIGADTAPCRTVVGVVQDTKRSPVGRTHGLRYYLPLAQAPGLMSQRFVFARVARPSEMIVSAVRAAAVSTSSKPFIEAFPLTQVLDPYTRPWRLGRAVFVAFGVLSTIIATIGLYGVIAFGVMQRRREFGIRLALGAPRASVLRSVMLGAGKRTAIGCAVGAGGAFVLGRRVHDLLFETSSTDAVVFAVALTVVVLAAVVASVFPAWRAVRVDPTVSLRAE